MVVSVITGVTDNRNTTRVTQTTAVSGVTETAAVSGPILPRVGPFASNAPVLISSLTNFTQTDSVAFSNAQNRGNPLKFNTLHVTGGLMMPDFATTAALFVWANNVLWDVTCGCTDDVASVAGGYGGNANGPCCGCTPVPASGGTGSGGGAGGGLAFDCGGAVSGANGGSGTDGNQGNSDNCCEAGGQNGAGFGQVDAAGFAYPSGGDGGAGGEINLCSTGQGGSGGPGYSGGGGSGEANNACGQMGFSPGGGAGGGLYVLICNSLTGFGTIQAPGGDGGSSGNNFINAGAGAGGGGVIWIAAKKYDGHTSTPISGGVGGNQCSCEGAGQPGTAGSAVIYEINHDGTLGPQRAFNQSWDNT